MPQHIQIEPKDEYLHVEASGAFDSANAKEFIRQILEACHQHDLWKIFVDIRKMEGPIPIMDRFELASFFAAEHAASVRLVVLESREQVPDDKFFETVAGNRGASVKVVSDLEEAWEYLELKKR